MCRGDMLCGICVAQTLPMKQVLHHHAGHAAATRGHGLDHAQIMQTILDQGSGCPL